MVIEIRFNFQICVYCDEKYISKITSICLSVHLALFFIQWSIPQYQAYHSSGHSMSYTQFMFGKAIGYTMDIYPIDYGID